MYIFQGRFNPFIGIIIKSARHPRLLTMADHRAISARWDVNGNGSLDKNDVLVGCLRDNMEEEEIVALFRALDVNKDGKISLDEWDRGYQTYRAATQKYRVVDDGPDDETRLSLR